MTHPRPAFSPETQTRHVDLATRRGTQPVAYADRAGDEPALLCLHGLGSTKDDYAALTRHPELKGRRIVAWDAPGSGDSPYPRTLTVEDLRDLAGAFRDAIGLNRPILVGHSMGGLTALLLARARPGAFRGFVNLEGNLTPEDCGVFSRAASSMSYARFEGRFFSWLEIEFERSACAGYAGFSRRFRANVTERAFWDYCRSIVRICDTEPLLSDFRTLPMPRLYLYGSENRGLSTVTWLRQTDVPVEEVPSSNHFPLDSNPEYTLQVLTRFCARGGSRGHRPDDRDTAAR